MTFETKMISGFIALVLLGCNDTESNDTLRSAPKGLFDTTLPDDDDSWKQQLPKIKKPGTGKAFRDGVATASEPLVAETAAKVLANGGNAIDAAVTAMFMLNVAEPQSSGIGGGGFVILHLADSNETLTLNCREKAPFLTPPDIFVSLAQDPALLTSSGYAVGVPGTVRCAATLLENWGTISLAEALAPAIEAAKDGIEVSSRLANDIKSAKLSNEMDDSPVKSHYDVARSVFRPNGVPLGVGELLVQPDLAHTFELIAEFGPDVFYRCDHEAGFGIAEAIVETQRVTRHTGNPEPEKKIGIGQMKCADLASYEVEILAPVSRSYRGYEVFSMGPPSSGGIAVLQILGMLEDFPIGADADFGFGDFATLNVMLEAMRLAFADRAMWVGDDQCLGCSGNDDGSPCPDDYECTGCLEVPVTGLLSDAYLDDRGELIAVNQRLDDIQAGKPPPYDSDDENLLGNPSDASETGGDTSHVSIIDADGNVVSFTMSLEEGWGTGLMVPGFGFLLNNQLTDFNRVPTCKSDPFDPGANDPGPGKQPRSSMAPTIVLLDGEPVAAYGSPGGATIINTVVSMTLNLIDHRMTLWESVKAPRISVASANDTKIAWEVGVGEAVLEELHQELGYSFNQTSAVIGAVQAIVSIPNSGKQYGAADARRIGGVFAADDL